MVMYHHGAALHDKSITTIIQTCISETGLLYFDPFKQIISTMSVTCVTATYFFATTFFRVSAYFLTPKITPSEVLYIISVLSLTPDWKFQNINHSYMKTISFNYIKNTNTNTWIWRHAYVDKTNSINNFKLTQFNYCD